MSLRDEVLNEISNEQIEEKLKSNKDTNNITKAASIMEDYINSSDFRNEIKSVMKNAINYRHQALSDVIHIDEYRTSYIEGDDSNTDVNICLCINDAPVTDIITINSVDRSIVTDVNKSILESIAVRAIRKKLDEFEINYKYDEKIHCYDYSTTSICTIQLDFTDLY